MKLLYYTLLLTFLLLISSSKKINENESNEKINDVISFNIPSGFYNKKKITLEIKSTVPDAIIYYTLDGHLPNENSTIYEKPLTLKNKSNDENVYSMTKGVSLETDYVPTKKLHKANIVRAIAKLPDGSFSNIISGSYFVGLNRKKLYGNLPVVSLITDPDNLFDYEKGIYVLGKRHDEWLAENPDNINAKSYNVQGNFSLKGKEYERPATLQYISGKNTTVDFTLDFGIRIKGKASRTYIKKSFRVISREEYGNKNVKYDLIPGNMRSDGKGPVTKYKSFILRNGGNDIKYAKMRETLLKSLISNPKFFETQQSDMAILFVDGEYWGIYDIYEEYSDHYISNNYDIDNKNVAIIKGTDNVEAGSEEDLQNVIESLNFIIDNDMTVPENYAKANELLDVEGFAWVGAIYTYVFCRDGWFRGGNYAMWRVHQPYSTVPKADGKWRLMIYDLDSSAGLLNDGYNKNDTIHEDLVKLININSSKYYNTHISRSTASLLNNTEFKNIFVNALCDIRNINFNKNVVNKRIDEMAEKLRPYLQESYDRYKLYGLPEEVTETNPLRYFNTHVRNLRDWLNTKYSNFPKLIEEDFNFKPAVKVTITANNFKKGNITMNNYNIITKKYTGDYFRENILYITANPAEGRTLKTWKINKCKIVSNEGNTIGIYPMKGCTITAEFK
ncbi:hypothetical protein PIROE2DRAFT_16307 [Piromyces sp. E2]|nr:hypothetical protein PIROE2DRAFT_16307 [Piromyces sp. E2]|eukprot:OUM58419.1 hypothetical protein PIROE2DRAFT_16307 [Piromyces sp. E2]